MRREMEVMKERTTEEEEEKEVKPLRRVCGRARAMAWASRLCEAIALWRLLRM